MPDVSFAVPDWIKPPSPEEQARIDEAELAAQRNAGFMIRRGIGMSRMNAEAQQAVQQGVDPVTARQTALMNNAHLLFADNPAAVANIVNSQEARQIKERALLQSQARLALEAQHYSNLAENAKATLAERAKYHADTLAQKEASGREFVPNIISVEDPTSHEQVPVLRTGPKTSEMVTGKTPVPSPVAVKGEERRKNESERKGILSVENLLQKDPNYTQLAKTLTDARTELDKAMRRKGSKNIFISTTQADVDKADAAVAEAAKKLNSYRKAVGKNMHVDLGEIESAASQPAALDVKQVKMPKNVKEGTIITQGGKRFFKIPGDPNDPGSWAEVQE